MSSQPLRPVPGPDDASEPFWEACARHELLLQACGDAARCGFPRGRCVPRATASRSAWLPASGRGRIWSWVIAHPPVLPAFADRAPYNVIVVELDEGVRMIGNLLDTPNDSITEGMPVEVAWEDVEEGVSLPVWRPAS